MGGGGGGGGFPNTKGGASNNSNKSGTPSNFGSSQQLEGHFDKHHKEFKGTYENSQEYLQGARDVVKYGIKVEYNYTYKGKTEVRTGYVKFMGNSKKGEAKFEFVGTNNNGVITTYHAESGKSFWKMLNGKNIKIINPKK